MAVGPVVGIVIAVATLPKLVFSPETVTQGTLALNLLLALSKSSPSAEGHLTVSKQSGRRAECGQVFGMTTLIDCKSKSTHAERVLISSVRFDDFAFGTEQCCVL